MTDRNKEPWLTAFEAPLIPMVLMAVAVVVWLFLR